MAKIFNWILTTLISLVIGIVFGALSVIVAVGDDYDIYRIAKKIAAYFD